MKMRLSVMNGLPSSGQGLARATLRPNLTGFCRAVLKPLVVDWSTLRVIADSMYRRVALSFHRERALSTSGRREGAWAWLVGTSLLRPLERLSSRMVGAVKRRRVGNSTGSSFDPSGCRLCNFATLCIVLIA